MKRRIFISSASTGLAMGTITNFNVPKKSKKKKQRKPKMLVPGNTIALIAPSSGIGPEQLEIAISNVKELGFVPLVSKFANEHNGFLAGTDEQRLFDIHSQFANDQVDAIWCIRGGYGFGRLLPKLDLNLIKKNLKLFIGYSDVTAFYQYAAGKGLVTVHGQVAGSKMTKDEQINMVKLL